jgi:hypothetical protein
MDKARMIGLRSHSFRVERLTVQTDHDTRASKIYTGETETYLIMRHRWRDLSIVDRGIDRSEHDLDDKICAEGRLCLTEGERIHHVLIINAISFIRVKTCCGY